MISRTLFAALKRLLTATLIVWALLAPQIATPAAAQESKVVGSIEGTVADASGALIPGATVVIRNVSTNQPRTLTADDHGFFRSGELPAATYDIDVSQPGFAPYRRTSVQVGLGETLHLSVVLSPASASTQLTVSSQPSALDTSQTSMVSSVDQERIEELPVRSRNYLDFVLLAPGGLQLPRELLRQQAQRRLPAAASPSEVCAPRSNNLSIDGLDNNDEFSGSSRISSPRRSSRSFRSSITGLPPNPAAPRAARSMSSRDLAATPFMATRSFLRRIARSMPAIPSRPIPPNLTTGGSVPVSRSAARLSRTRRSTTWPPSRSTTVAKSAPISIPRSPRR